MRVAYLISCFHPYNTGNGGHYYSLMTIASAYRRCHRDVEIKVFSFGNRIPSALRNFEGDWQHVNIGPSNILSAGHAVSEWKPDVIHAYDRRSLYFGRRAAARLGVPVVFTKPGGPNARYLPVADRNIFFSKENFDFYSKRHLEYCPRFALVPQRTSPASPDIDRLALLKEILPSGKTRILRISRIGEYYRNSIEQTIWLAQKLRESGIPSSAVIIGTVESSEVADRLRASLHADDAMINDPLFTNKAAALISVADFVVGTGRGFMEAAMAGLPTLCPSQSGPVLLTEESLSLLSEKNFSSRVAAAPELVGESVDSLVRAAKDTGFMDQLRSATRMISDGHFNVNSALAVYDEMYRSAAVLSKPFYDMPILFMGVAKAALP